MLAVGNEELSDIRCQKGDIVIFTKDGIDCEAVVEFAIDTKTKEETNILSFANWNGHAYLVGINGKFFPNKKGMYNTRMKNPVKYEGV